MKKVIITLIMVFVAVCGCSAVSAAVTDINQYHFMPVKSGAQATELLKNADGSDAVITPDDNGAEITFSGNAESRKRTTVELDLGDVSGRRMKYVSFDMTADQLMDLVVTMDPYDVSAYTDNRPHSLFIGKSGIMSVTIHTPRIKYNTATAAEGYQSAISTDWWTSSGHTIDFVPRMRYNVVLIANSMTMNPSKTDSGSGAPIAESDEVSVYIDGVRRGQLSKTVNRLEAWRNNKLSFIHYTTGAEEQKLTLDNLEVGFCEKVAKEATEELNANDGEWSFPDGENAYITMKVPTASETAFLINSTGAEGQASLGWYKTFGVCDAWTESSFTAGGECTSSYEDVYKTQNVHTWTGGDEIEVTFEINRTFKTIEVYTDKGHYRKGYYGTEPQTVKLVNIVGETKPSKVWAGTMTAFGFDIIDANGNPTRAFRNGSYLGVSAVGYGGESGEPFVIYTFNDVFGNIIKVDATRPDTYSNGLFAVTGNNGFGDYAPDGATEMRVYLWDGAIRPLCKVIKAEKEDEIYEDIYSYEVSDVGRYRLTCALGAGTAETDGNVIRVLRNGKMFWEQLMVNGEDQNLDVGLYAEDGDLITVSVGSESGAASANYSDKTFSTERYFLSEERFPATSAGRKNSYVKKYTFGSFIGTTQGDKGTEIYSVKNDKKYPMERNASTGRWWSTVEGDTGYVDTTVVRPGTQGSTASETVTETTLDRAGLLRLDGTFWVDEGSDGVLASAYINDKLVWSNRVGGTRAVRWDEPYDTVYFLNEINVIAKVNVGDKLKFVFNKWRKSSHTDHFQLRNMTINYVRGDVLSKTTKWKLGRSIVVDTVDKYVRRSGVTADVEAVFRDGDVLVELCDIKTVLGSDTEAIPETTEIDGREYVSLKAAAEMNGKYMTVAADRVAMVHEAMPVYFGFSELSEIKTMFDCGESLFE